jgi:hypothetical protein
MMSSLLEVQRKEFSRGHSLGPREILGVNRDAEQWWAKIPWNTLITDVKNAEKFQWDA